MNFSIKGPQISAYSVTINVPCKPIIIIKRDIEAWEGVFIKLRDECNKPFERKQYDGCRAVLKWAGCCGAELIRVNNVIDLNDASYIEFSFSFTDIKDLSYFSKDFYNCTRV